MPSIDYRRLRQRVSMTKVLELIGFRATWRRGPQLRGPCPIPYCPSASGRHFSVHLARQVYHCFACNGHGNALDLWAAVQRLPLHQAAITLCHAANLAPPQLSTPRHLRHIPFRASSRNH
jgi:DNA primase